MSICNSDPVFYFMISLGSSEILSYRFAGSMPLVGKRAVICRDVPLFEAFQSGMGGRSWLISIRLIFA
jgi:hypothetical protein